MLVMVPPWVFIGTGSLSERPSGGPAAVCPRSACGAGSLKRGWRCYVRLGVVRGFRVDHARLASAQAGQGSRVLEQLRRGSRDTGPGGRYEPVTGPPERMIAWRRYQG